MRPRTSTSWLALVWLVMSVLLGCGGVVVFHRQLAGAWFAFGVHPDVLALLEQSMEDQKLLAHDRPEEEQRFRQRFEATRETLNRLHILSHSRSAIIRRYELVLLGLFSGTVVLTGAGYVLHQRRSETRLRGLQRALTELSLGNPAISVGDRRRDTIGRIAGMIEQTSRVMGADRRRLAALRHLESWQEAARRQAHEMRTPLTAARIELRRLGELVAGSGASFEELATQLAARLDGLRDELAVLEGFVHRFSSFARLARPRPEPIDLGVFVTEIRDLYAEVWPMLDVVCRVETGPVVAMVDRDMLRQVLVNLLENSALAIGDRPGEVLIEVVPTPCEVRVDVADDGSGVDPAIRDRLFEPYVTTRPVGQGTGLGLAVSKKILLDHGGDLELIEDDRPGARFRLVLPRRDGRQDEEGACRVAER